MRKIRKDDYWSLAVFCMDYHSGQWSRGYRILSRLRIDNFSSTLYEELRDTEIYHYLEAHYKDSV